MLNATTTSTKDRYLYHYTSQRGLLGIIQDRTLKMTNILYLNDSNEFLHPMKLFKDKWNICMKKTFNYMNLKKFKKGFALSNEEINKRIAKGNKEFDRHTNIFGMNIFVFSLSGRGNDLIQWREYCPDTGGFCIEFDRKKLFDLVKNKDNYEIKKCLYKKEKIKEINRIFLDYLPDYKTNITNWIRGCNDDVIINFFNNIVKNSPFLKDDSFIHEEEYRIVYQGGNGKFDKEIDFKEGKTMIKPYRKFNFNKDKITLPITKIWVGPTQYPELSSMSVKKLLDICDYKKVDVEISKIPYRPT